MLFDSPSPCALLHPRLQSVQPKMRVFVARRGWLAGSQAKPTARAFLCVGASSALDSSGQQASLLYFRALFNGRVGRPSAPAVKETDCFPTCRVLRRCASKNVLCWLCLSLRMAMSLLLQPADPLSRLPSDRTHGEAACCCEACVACRAEMPTAIPPFPRWRSSSAHWTLAGGRMEEPILQRLVCVDAKPICCCDRRIIKAPKKRLKNIR